MSVWLNEHLGGSASLTGPAYLPAGAIERLECIRQARMLYRGQHYQYFVGDRRTRYDFPTRKVGGVSVTPYVQMNLLRLITRKTVDLIVGEAPIIKIERASGMPDSSLTELWQTIGGQSMVHLLLIDALTATSWAGVSYIEAVRFDGRVYLRRHPSGLIVPEGELQPDGQYPVYAKYTEHRVDDKNSLLLIERWSKGMIRRELLSIDQRGVVLRSLPLERWPAFAVKAPPAEEQTEVADNTMVAVFNESSEDDQGNIVVGVSDYDGLVGLQDTVNSKFTGMVRVIDDNIDPTLTLPVGAADSTGGSRVRFKTIFLEPGEQAPGYLVYNAPLDSAIKDRVEVVNVMLILAEMSPSLLGIKNDAAVDSARKMRLAAAPAIARGKRTSVRIRPAIEKAIGIALALSARTSQIAANVSVEFRDGLPIDDGELATTISTLRSSGVMSREAALELRFGGDRVAIEEELKRLDAEDEAGQAQIVLGNLQIPPATEPGETPTSATDDVGETTATVEGGVA